MWHTQPPGATLVSSPPQDDALWQAYARVPDHTPHCTSSSQMPYKGSSSESLFDSSWPSFIFPSIFRTSCLFCTCLTTFSCFLPSPSYSRIMASGSHSHGTYETITYRNTHVQTRTLFKGNLDGERWLCPYWHLFLLFSLFLIRLWALGRQRFFELLRPISSAYGHKPS